MDDYSSQETQKTTTSNRNVDDQDDHHHPNPTNPFVQILQQPIQWLQMLSSELNPTFVLGVVLVYGLSQGFSGSYFKVVTDYYWKDVQKLQPSVVQLYIGLYYIPWLMKPVWGLLTDVFPVRGYRRRPYFVLAGVIGTVSALTVAFSGNLAAVVALTWLIGVTAGVAIADVTIDACIARNSIEIRSLASDLQSLCGFCSSAGALVGYSTSGFFVHHLGPQGALGLLAIPPIFLTVLGFVIYEQRSTNLHSQRKRAVEEVGVAMSGIYKTIKLPQVWKPSLYMYLSLALSINTQEGNFYWYTDPSAGPAFSQEFVGMIYAVGAVASIVGVLIYHKTLKNYPFRNLVFFAQLLYAMSGLLDLTFILRWNLALGIPDYFFVIMEECVFRIVTKIRWMPMIVLSTRLCPLGIEGTFFALLMCIDSLGSLSSKWGGGAVLHALNVTRTNFTNMWLALLIRNVLRFLTLGLIFLVPKADQLDLLIPSDLLTKNSFEFSDVDDQSLELVPSKGKIEV
ncbi:probable folate-biopterin transporter 6 isoform X1 [Malus sylvestris]|uniref:probable folate-biopterin transporter 6 isoform X1 n=1 Tax=Malus sylvestris TaxID=3752 RepID=UPI0021ACB049|nr:probable folate-biopterin transporter 6 isoform X1 [Malus sylvestris]